MEQDTTLVETPKVKIVLVHGLWCDASIWKKVIPRLTDEYEVYTVQLPLTTLIDNINTLINFVEGIDSKVLLVGHSYGSFVISEASFKLKNNVIGLAHISGIIPNAGQSIVTLLGGIFQNLYHGQGFVSLNIPFAVLNSKFSKEVLAHDTTDEDAAIWLQNPLPTHKDCLENIAQSDLYNKLSFWYLITDDDRFLPLGAQITMSAMLNAKVTHISASHASILSRDKKVAKFIKNILSNKYKPTNNT